MTRASVTKDRWMIAGAAFVALAAGFVAYSPAPVGVFWDDAVYVITAKALASGEGYRFIHLPNAPAATHYPPLWPAILAVIWKIAPDFPENVRWMKVLNPVFLSVAAAGVTVLGVRVARIPFWLSAAIAALTIIVAPVLLLSAVLMSEPLALALSAFALSSMTLVVMRGRSKDGFVTGLLVGLAVLARSAAIVLLPAILIGLVWRRSRRASGIALAVTLVLILPWFVWSGVYASELPPAMAGSYGPYGSWLINGYRADLGLLRDVVSINVGRTFHEVGVVLFGAFPRSTRPFLLALLVTSTVAGLFLVRRRVLPTLVALAAYLVLILIWPYAPGRFVWIYAPLYAVLVAAAVGALLRRAKTQRSLRIPGAIAAAVAAAALLSVVRYDVRGFQQGWHRLAIEPLADGVTAPVKWIATNTAPTDTIASDVHLQAYLYAGRIGLPISSLTVAEYVVPKTDSSFQLEYTALDSTYRPHWWIATSRTPELRAIVQWASRPGKSPRFALGFPDSGLAVRVRGR
jgi:Gpi18-like mannosyltransferase